MPSEKAYANYKQYAVDYPVQTGTFSVFHAQRGRMAEQVTVERILWGAAAWTLGDYGTPSWVLDHRDDATLLTIQYAGEGDRPAFGLRFCLNDQGVGVTFLCRGDLDVHIGGLLCWGHDMEHDTFAMNLGRQGPDLRAACGPASSIVDNALFDRMTDTALQIQGASTTRIAYDWALGAYRFHLHSGGDDFMKGFRFAVHEEVYARRFALHYSPVNPGTTFPRPPAGWMTWYAVQFDAGEEAVLRNARWQAEHLKDFGADALWVDWEWYHSNLGGVGQPGVDVFHPDPARYPRGLAALAQDITDLGLTPALWIGATNDPTENEFIAAHPETVLVRRPSWCGQYFLDLTHPLVLREYLPRVFKQIVNWGYKALKWDCLPITIQYLDQYHDRLYNPEKTSEQAMLDAVEAASQVVGPDFYMLYCAGMSDRDMGVAAAAFDAARIGGDIFKWEDFIRECVAKVLRYYTLHQVALLNDPDNVILRPEFNTYDQALSRLSFVALLGLPLTLGDELPELPEDRVELLRRGLPPVPCHPMDVGRTAHDLTVIKLNLAVNRPFGQWNVVDVFNLQEQDTVAAVDILEDLHLPPEEGPYLIYDFWNRQYLGQTARCFDVTLRPCASRVFAVRRRLPHPQVLSTSRHISQGAWDLEDVRWDEDSRTLSGVSRVVAGDPYRILLHVPEGCEPLADPDLVRVEDSPCWELTRVPEQTGALSWAVRFR